MSPKSGNAPAKSVFFSCFSFKIDYKSLEIDHAENRKERIGILSYFPANLSFFELATGATDRKQETVRRRA